MLTTDDRHALDLAYTVTKLGAGCAHKAVSLRCVDNMLDKQLGDVWLIANLQFGQPSQSSAKLAKQQVLASALYMCSSDV